MSSCFFVGNGNTAPYLMEEIQRHITEYGVKNFVVSSLGGFDFLAAKAVVAAKHKFPDITLSLIVVKQVGETGPKIPDGVDFELCSPKSKRMPKWFAMIKAQRKIIDRVNHLIIHDWQSLNSTRELVEYARMREQKGLIRIKEL